MKINTKVRYGLRTMIAIASTPDTDGVLQKDISEYQDISLKYLDSIISSLKLKGLIVNVKGKGSGYKLSRSANEISLYDIYTAFERLDFVDCLIEGNNCPWLKSNCKANACWADLKLDFSTMLMNKKLSDIV